MRSLQLERPLVVFDLETTGKDIGRDRVVEIAVIRVEPDGRRGEWAQRINPEMPISPGATAVHGITDADVRDMPTFGEIADRVHELFAGADVAGYNSLGFDLPLLAAEFERVGRPLDRTGARHVDAMRIFHLKEPRNLAAALRFYCGRALEDAHSALADTRATFDILLAQVDRYADLPQDVPGLHGFCQQGRENAVDPDGKLVWSEEGEAVFTFGKYKGWSLRKVRTEDPSYLRFLQREDLDRPFSAELRRLAREAAAGRFPERPAAVPSDARQQEAGGAPTGLPEDQPGDQRRLF